MVQDMPEHLKFQKMPKMSLLEWRKAHNNHKIEQFMERTAGDKNIEMIVLSCQERNEMYVRDTVCNSDGGI